MLKHKLILWTPRILSILLIALMFLLSFDVFEMDDVWYMLLAGFLIHNIPVFILSATLIAAWRHPLVGAFIYIPAGLVYGIFILIRGGMDMIDSVLILGGSAVIIGLLFYLTHIYQLTKR